jgi:hypothetical protein
LEKSVKVFYYGNGAVLSLYLKIDKPFIEINQQFSKEVFIMPMFLLKATGVIGTIMVILALVITLLKQIIAFIGIISFVVKAFVVLAFVTVFLLVGLMMLRTFRDRRKSKE